MKMTIPEGVVNAILTPFKEDGKIDYPLLEKQTLFLVDGGLDGLFVNGSTGEGLLLTIDEKYEKPAVYQRNFKRQDRPVCLLYSTYYPSGYQRFGKDAGP